MESGQRVQPLKLMLFCGILGAILLVQGAASLQCYSCKDVGDGGCAPNRRKIEECVPPRNVCLEATFIVTLVNLTLLTAMKGCDVGPNGESGFTSFLPEVDGYGANPRSHACSENLCNTLLVTGDVSQLPNNTIRYFVPNGNECYYCLSFTEDQCLAKKDAVMKCYGDATACDNDSNTITMGNLYSITVPYFMKKCSYPSCGRGTAGTQYVLVNSTGSCCSGKLCNVPPNTGLRPTTCVAHLILAAILAITRM